MNAVSAVANEARSVPVGPKGPVRLLLDGPRSEPTTLAQHRATYAQPRHHGRSDRHIIDAVTAAGLLGRGGASFPTGRKLAAVAGGRRGAVVVINGSEGEPLSNKDRWLLARVPHLVLDGAAIAARAVGSHEVHVCIDRGSTRALRAMARAVAERSAQEPAGPAFTIHDLPPRYVAGDESAIVNWLNGGPAKPTMPPRPYERGVGGRPTFVSNVETYAHMTQIMRWGPQWFRGQGTADHPGTMLATVGGAVQQPGVVEVGVGTRIVELVRAAGGPTDGVQAVLVGGYFGAWLSNADAASATLSNESLRPFGAALGCGAVTVLPRSACGVLETARIMAWFSAESAGQCGSCVHGLAALAGGTADLLRHRSNDVAQLERWAAMVDGRGACHLPSGAVRLLRSALSVFADDIDGHRRGIHCAGSTARPWLPVPMSEGPVEWQ